MLAGLAIDALDLATFGPIGIYTGMILGVAIGWWLAPELGFPPRARWLSGLMTGVYCTLPLTGFIPAATIAAGVTRAILRDKQHADPTLDPGLRSRDTIDVEYEVLDDEAGRPTRPRPGIGPRSG